MGSSPSSYQRSIIIQKAYNNFNGGLDDVDNDRNEIIEAVPPAEQINQQGFNEGDFVEDAVFEDDEFENQFEDQFEDDVSSQTSDFNDSDTDGFNYDYQQDPRQNGVANLFQQDDQISNVDFIQNIINHINLFSKFIIKADDQNEQFVRVGLQRDFDTGFFRNAVELPYIRNGWANEGHLKQLFEFPGEENWFENKYPQVARVQRILRNNGINPREVAKAMPSRMYNEWQLELAFHMYLQFNRTYNPDDVAQFYGFITDLNQRNIRENSTHILIQLTQLECIAFAQWIKNKNMDAGISKILHFSFNYLTKELRIRLDYPDLDNHSTVLVRNLNPEIKKRQWHNFILLITFDYCNSLGQLLDQNTLERIQYWRNIITNILDQQERRVARYYRPRVLFENIIQGGFRARHLVSVETVRFQTLATWDKILGNVQNFTQDFVNDFDHQMDIIRQAQAQFRQNLERPENEAIAAEVRELELIKNVNNFEELQRFVFRNNDRHQEVEFDRKTIRRDVRDELKKDVRYSDREVILRKIKKGQKVDIDRGVRPMLIQKTVAIRITEHNIELFKEFKKTKDYLFEKLAEQQ